MVASIHRADGPMFHETCNLLPMKLDTFHDIRHGLFPAINPDNRKRPNETKTLNPIQQTHEKLKLRTRNIQNSIHYLTPFPEKATEIVQIGIFAHFRIRKSLPSDP